MPKIRDKSWEIEDIESINVDWKEVKVWVLTKEQVLKMIEVLVWKNWVLDFIHEKEIDSSYSFREESRYRVNCYMDSAWYSIALRLIPNDIPTIDELWLPEHIKDMCSKSKWLILVTGPTWSWKSTNLAAMLEYINRNKKKHIITIEDPIEFSFTSDKSLINQREIWNDTNSFAHAIRACLREDPDVIMMWEMRDPETIKAAITLAETWHLVLSTLHTNDSVQTVDRIVDIFPAEQQKQIRTQLAQSLVWVNISKTSTKIR